MLPHLGKFLSRLGGVRTTPSGFMACCPCPGHGDHGKGDGDPSLSVALGEDGRVLLNCFAGCTPDAVLDKIENSAKQAMKDAKWEEALARDGLELPPDRSRADFTKFVAGEHAFWGKKLKALNIEME